MCKMNAPDRVTVPRYVARIMHIDKRYIQHILSTWESTGKLIEKTLDKLSIYLIVVMFFGFLTCSYHKRIVEWQGF